MKRIVYLSYFLMAVAAGLALLLAWQYQSLSDTVRQQREEIARHNGIVLAKAAIISRQQQQITSNARSLEEITERLTTLRTVAAQQSELLNAARGRLAVLQAENRERATLIARQGAQISEGRQQLAENQARLTATQSASNYVEGGSYGMMDLAASFASRSSYAELLGHLMTALQARIRAASLGNYEDMRSKYLAIVPLLDRFPESEWTRAWRALVAEGIAYADMKLHRLSEAETAIRQARELNPDHGGEGMTALKIMCRQGRPAAEVQDQFSVLVRRLDLRVAQPNSDERLARNARVLRRFLSTDAELYHLCTYADLAPSPVPSD